MIARGSVVAIRDGFIDAQLPAARAGMGVVAGPERDAGGTVVAIERGCVRVAMHQSVHGLRAGDPIEANDAAHEIRAGILGTARAAVPARVPRPDERCAPREIFWTGISAIDALLTVARGARAGIFAPPGCGKSVLLEQLCSAGDADAIVVSLTGERGREAQAWASNLPASAALFCATSDAPAVERVRCAEAAMAHAAVLRAYGLHVLMVLDSLARYAFALRELAVACGEPCGRAGYPASVFARMARLVEVAGALQDGGSITLFATVLEDGDSRDPVSEAARSLLDGHIALSPALAAANRFPAIDVVASRSRTMEGVADAAHIADAATVRAALACLNATAEARALGITPAGGDAARAVAAEAGIEALLRAKPEAGAQALEQLHELADTLR